MNDKSKLVPTSIKKEKHYLLKAEWKDGFSALIDLKNLREECPCADCNEDEFHPKKNLLATFQQGQNELKQLIPVGNYAINAVWGDGHKTGIYPWELFRKIFEKYGLSKEDLKKLEEDKPKEPLPELKIKGN